MADYFKAISDTLLKEGAYNDKLGYVNDPDDRGGETVAGIARKFWGNLGLWNIVDLLKKEATFPYNLKKNEILIQQIMTFYKKEFWDKIGGDKIKSEFIADKLLKSAVHEGFKPAIKRAEMLVGLAETGVITDELIKRLNNL